MQYRIIERKDKKMENTATVITETPDDLMSLREICLKHRFNYNYLYKCAIQKRAIKVYFRGNWKLSEREVLDWSSKLAQEKLKKLKSRKAEI